jgi:CBS domain-containing protein
MNNEAVFRIAAFRYNETLQHIMNTSIYVCRPDDPVQPVAEEMAKRRISSVIVTDENKKPLGIVTERDMVRKVVAECREHGFVKEINEIMTPAPVCLSPDDTLFDALSVIAKHHIKHLPVVNESGVIGIVTLRQLMKIRYSEPFVVIGQLEEAESIDDFRNIKNALLYLVKEKLTANTDPVDIVTMLSLINSGIHKRLLRKAINSQGTEPPVGFSFFVTGSHGRRENLLFPDQDFCVITENYPDSQHEEVDRYFLEVSKNFSDYLNAVGFPYCSGEIMGQNPKWRMKISSWQAFVSDVFKKEGPYTVRYMTLIFDSAHLFGSQSLFDSYMDHAFTQMSHNYNILRQMHDEEEGRHKVPLGLFNSFITEKNKEHKGKIDMKKSGLIFIIEAARILALKNSIRETSTLDRIHALVEKNIIHKDDSEYFENAYRIILYHTLHAQVDNYLEKSSDDYYLTPGNLSKRNQEMLKEAFKAISKLKDIVGSEFGDLIL